MIHIDYSPIKGCKHPEWTYGEICVKCGECGRYDAEFQCVNCGFKGDKKPRWFYNDWGIIEFYDGWFYICPTCKPLFPKEDQTQVEPWWSNKIIPCRHNELQRRVNITITILRWLK